MNGINSGIIFFAKIKDFPKTRNVTVFRLRPKPGLGIDDFKFRKFSQKDVVLMLCPYKRFWIFF